MRYFLAHLSLGVALCGLFAPLPSQAAAAAEQVVCHYTYGGEKKQLAVSPVASPYTVAPIQVGSYFLLRVVFERPPGAAPAVNIYVYADKDDGPVPLHHASHPYPAARAARSAYGFTGLQRVYEPVRDGELEYWCAANASGSAA